MDQILLLHHYVCLDLSLYLSFCGPIYHSIYIIHSFIYIEATLRADETILGG